MLVEVDYCPSLSVGRSLVELRICISLSVPGWYCYCFQSGASKARKHHSVAGIGVGDLIWGCISVRGKQIHLRHINGGPWISIQQHEGASVSVWTASTGPRMCLGTVSSQRQSTLVTTRLSSYRQQLFYLLSQTSVDKHFQYKSEVSSQPLWAQFTLVWEHLTSVPKKLSEFFWSWPGFPFTYKLQSYVVV